MQTVWLPWYCIFMSLFSLALPLVFFLFWKSLSDDNRVSPGGIWALVLGTVLAIVQYMFRPVISSGEFGLIQWLAGFVNIIALPVLAGLVVCLLFKLLNLFSSGMNITNFLLLWCIPFGIFWTMAYSKSTEPLYLVIVPLLWVGMAVGFGFFISKIGEVSTFTAVFCIAGAVILPFVAATAYWFLFCQNYLLGYMLFGAALVPMVINTGYLFCSALQGKS